MPISMSDEMWGLVLFTYESVHSLKTPSEKKNNHDTTTQAKVTKFGQSNARDLSY
jgi:hypothetical protein